jgi:hypothetical protein
MPTTKILALDLFCIIKLVSFSFFFHFIIFLVGDIDDLIEGELTDIGDTLEAGLLYLTRNVNEQRKEPIEKRIRVSFEYKNWV